MTVRRISATLVGDGGMVCCRACSHALAPAGQGWKARAVLSTVAVRELPGAASAVEGRVVLRRFACPGCGTLLDTEIALPEDPYLEDRVAL